VEAQFTDPVVGQLRSRGVTLIMVAAVLAILAAMASGFYTMSLMQTKSAMHYAESVRAQMLCTAGVHYATAQLRQQAFLKPEDPSDPWFTVDYLHGKAKNISFPADLSRNGVDDDFNGAVDNVQERKMSFSLALSNYADLNSDRAILAVTDAASKININAGDNLAVILDNLCRVIGPPLAAANLDALQPRRWFTEMPPGHPAAPLYNTALNAKDTADINSRDLYYQLTNASGTVMRDGTGRPIRMASGVATYGDGYAIAGYRARHGRFNNLEDVRNALTYVERNNNATPDDPLEQLEIEVKYAALRPYITLDSWVDTNTVCVGKFEWVFVASSGPKNLNGRTIAVDRDKSWVSSVDDNGNDIPDPLNTRGTLVGCYLSIINGHGAGQLRRIKRNGIDWVDVDSGFASDPSGGPVFPGPISSYMVIAKEDAKTDKVSTPDGDIELPQTDPNTGVLVDDPNLNYQLRPLCIHRAPVNINTASDKVLAALFMGLNVQHGHPMAIGTDADRQLISPAQLPAAAGATNWKMSDQYKLEPYLLTLNGIKRIPASSGKIVFDRTMDNVRKLLPKPYDVEYLNDHGAMDPSGQGKMNEAQELAIRIISARQRKIDPATGKPVPPTSSDPDPFSNYQRGPFTSWDDFFFRVVKPWDDDRRDSDLKANPTAPKKVSVARMIMANFNSNTDMLKFNPNIEWIDRWGRNFTEMEPVMAFDPGATSPKWLPGGLGSSQGLWDYTAVTADPSVGKGAYYPRSMRYKSDELIDKTDLNRSTTEFVFDSGGIYEIESTGQVVKRSHLLAERKVRALVKVYDVWRESTQAQFVQGRIYSGPAAPRNQLGTSCSGQVARDSYNPPSDASTPRLLPLTTWPEPLVPLKYMIQTSPTNPLTDVVSGGVHYDAFGRSRPVGQPDVLANRVLPAQYDGQIALATNTSWFKPEDSPDNTDANNKNIVTFLASFNGDLDTDTSNGNGREQAKSPADKRVRVLDTIGLLGRLNDTQIDFDPMDPAINASYATFPADCASGVYKSLNAAHYWENVTCRQGDLRPEGVWAGAVGVSGRDGTFKYLTGQTDADNNKGDPNEGKDNKNYVPTFSPGGDVICMWFKPAWQGTDHREHGFFSANNTGHEASARYDELLKGGRFSWAEPQYDNSNGGNNPVDCNLYAGIEDHNDADLQLHLHGGMTNVTKSNSVRESPSFHVQPFRWSFVGMRQQWGFSGIPQQGTKYLGFWSPTNPTGADGNSSNPTTAAAARHCRPFIDTARDPEGESSVGWDDINDPTPLGARYFWESNSNNLGWPDVGVANNSSCYKQEAAWDWADGGTSGQSVFGANNLNWKGGASNYMWLYRACPIDGTYAVLDEYKIIQCKQTLWTSARIKKEMTISRYYLPGNSAADTANAKMCPQFVSQSLLSSLRNATKATHIENVALARVSWTVFTPRFLWEYIDQKGKRQEIIHSFSKQANFRGPFDFVQYNWDILPNNLPNMKDGSGLQYEPDINPQVSVPGSGGALAYPLWVKRPSPADYRAAKSQPYAGRGVEIELLNSATIPNASTVPIVCRPLAGKTVTTLVDPDDIANNLVSGDLSKPPTMVPAQNLYYRVRFRYPIDPFVAQPYSESATTVHPKNHYLLDTPIFDDISIVYVIAPRYLTYKEVTE